MSYHIQLPDVPFDPAYAKFFESFYRISDTPDAHEKYSEQFTKDATLIMGSKEANGRKEILALRKGMWEKVASREHDPVKIFPFGAASSELMLYGNVSYQMKSGTKAGLMWAARAVMAEEDGEVKMSYYQVYLDTAAQQQAAKES